MLTIEDIKAIAAAASVLHEPEELDRLHTSVPDDYIGHCSVELHPRAQARIVFPNAIEAHRAAEYAVGARGGYAKAIVEPAPEQLITHLTWRDWAFS